MVKSQLPDRQISSKVSYLSLNGDGRDRQMRALATCHHGTGLLFSFSIDELQICKARVGRKQFHFLGIMGSLFIITLFQGFEEM